MGGLVELESGFVSHADLRGNELTSGGYASSLLVVYASEADAGLSNFVLAGNKVEAHSLYGTALQVEAELGDATVRNGDLVGNHFAGAFGSSGVALITGGIDEDDVVVDLSNLQLVNNTYDGEGNGDGELLAVVPWDEEGFSLRYSNLFGNSSDQTSWGDPTGVDGNISADPLYTDVSGTDPTAWDLSLQAGSPALDAGDPDVTDDDGSGSDMGAYGGPDGTAW